MPEIVHRAAAVYVWVGFETANQDSAAQARALQYVEHSKSCRRIDLEREPQRASRASTNDREIFGEGSSPGTAGPIGNQRIHARGFQDRLAKWNNCLVHRQHPSVSFRIREVEAAEQMVDFAVGPTRSRPQTFSRR